MDRLHQQAYITDPRGKAKSVVFTEEGLGERSVFLREIFELHSQHVKATNATELLDPKQFTTDFEIRDFGYDHTAMGIGKRREPLPASQDNR